jgi:protein SCO1
MPWYGCTMLCTQMLNGVLFTLKEMKFDVGREFDVVAISIDPREKHQLAAEKKEHYFQRYGREGTSAGWHFLTGDEDQIKRVADSIGYRYRYDRETDQYAHASGIVVLTPEGKISHYFYGVDYPAGDLRLSLVEASQNKIGNPVDRLMLFCFHYDPTTGKYGVVIMNVVRLLGVVTVFAICAFISLMLYRERRAQPGPASPELNTRG